MEDSNKLIKLTGNFDLPLTHACTMGCSGCSYTDYKDMGNTICNLMRFDDVKYIAHSIMDMNVKLRFLSFLGGEPTIHPEFDKIAEWLYQYKDVLFEKLVIHTNGTNLNKRFLDSVKYFDMIKMSLYPMNRPIKQEMIDSGMDEWIRNQDTHIWYKEIDEFEIYGEERDDLEYSKKLNWERCSYKWTCRVLTREGIYRCFVMYNNRVNVCDYSDRDKFIEYVMQEKDPMKPCKGCPMPPQTKKWESNTPERDRKSINHGIKLIRNFDK